MESSINKLITCQNMIGGVPSQSITDQVLAVGEREKVSDTERGHTHTHTHTHTHSVYILVLIGAVGASELVLRY